MEESEELSNIIQQSLTKAISRNYEFFTPELLLLEALSLPSVIHVLEDTCYSIEEIRQELEEYINDGMPLIEQNEKNMNLMPEVSVGLNEVYQQASEIAKNAGRRIMDVFDVLVAMFENKKLFCSFAMRKCGIQSVVLLEAISIHRCCLELGMSLEDDIPSDSEDFDETTEKDDFLSKYTVNLNEKARQGEFDGLVGRESELARTIDILCRRTKNNPIHVGDSGVGKTAIAEGLAARFVSGDVPERIQGFEIYSLDITELLSGAKFRGDLENRIKKIVNALEAKGKCILYIDEIHTLMGLGGGNSGSSEAVNILKPILMKNNVRVMGSTTFEEYTKYIEKNHALARRFQKISIVEPTIDETVEILKSLAPKFEKFHSVKYSSDVLRLAVKLSVQYISDRCLPDKAIDIIDEAGVYRSLQAEKRNKKRASRSVVTENDIKQVTAKMVQVPIEDVTKSEKSRLKELEEKVSSLIFGQKKAVYEVCLAVKKARAGFKNPDKPEASFLFVGPTGVGKTELARVLGSVLGENLVRFDMSEYQEQYTVSRLIGSAPGYVGYENGGLLTEQVRKNPHSIVLFDEIEKAHEDIYNILLQVLDYGTLTDNQGRKTDFKNCIIIMTSNAGACDMEKGSVGFSSGENYKNDELSLKEAVEKTFSPEFRNRLDAIIPFRHLEKDIVIDIVKKAVGKISERLAEKNVQLTVSPAAMEYLATEGYSREFGARNIARTVEERIAAPLVDEVLFGALSDGGKVSYHIANGKPCFKY